MEKCISFLHCPSLAKRSCNCIDMIRTWDTDIGFIQCDPSDPDQILMKFNRLHKSSIYHIYNWKTATFLGCWCHQGDSPIRVSLGTARSLILTESDDLLWTPTWCLLHDSALNCNAEKTIFDLTSPWLQDLLTRKEMRLEQLVYVEPNRIAVLYQSNLDGTRRVRVLQIVLV
jgi:hypothetical protein